jgi:DNA-binding LytR/AlgR family response regulator
VDKVRERFSIIKTEEPVQSSMFIRIDNQLRQIDFAKIMYVSGLKDYVHIYLTDELRPLITHLTMKAMEEMLPSSRFMRVHRSFIISLDKIKSVDRNSCIYIGNEVIRVTDAYKENFETYLNNKIPR